MQVSFNYCPTAFNLDLLVYTEMLCKDAVDLNALKEDVFHLAQSKICTTRNLGLSNLVNADYKIKYDNEIQLAEGEEMVDFGSEPYVEDYKIQTSEERCAIPDIDILQRELEKMQAELGLQDIVSEEVDLDNLENSGDNSQQTKFYSNVESDSNLAEDKVEEVEEKEEDENSSVSEADLITEADESKAADNQVISSSEIEDKSDEKIQEELLEEAKREYGISDNDEIPDFSSLCSGFMLDNADILSNSSNADSENEAEQGTLLEEEQDAEQDAKEQGTNDFEDEYLDNDILKSIEVVECVEEDTDFDYPDEEEQGIQFEDDSDDFSSDEEGSEDISGDEEDEEDSYDFDSDEDDDSEDISSDYEDEEDDSKDISSGYEDDDEEDEDVYDFSESDDDEDDDISSDESDDQPVEESVIYEDEYLDSDIYSNIKILKKVRKKKQGVSEASSSSSARQTTKSKKSSSTLGVETKKARDSRNVNDSSKSSGSLSKASKEVPKGAPSLERVGAQPEKFEFGSRDEEPKDLRSFLRKHPHCEISVVYKYFTKKEVQNALFSGKVIKKGTQLHI